MQRMVEGSWSPPSVKEIVIFARMKELANRNPHPAGGGSNPATHIPLLRKDVPMKTLSIDIETYSDIPLQKTGVYRYCESPNFGILLFGVQH